MLVAPEARTAYLLLRFGAAFAFVYPPLSALFGDPYSWLGYFPSWALSLGHAVGMGDLVILHSVGIAELIIGLWILSGYKIFIPAILAGLMLVGIVVFNGSQFDILFRDLSLAALCLALALMHRPYKNRGL